MPKYKRLEKAAEVLENLKVEAPNINNGIQKFNMDVWHCGTEACAMGHFMYHPWFAARGLGPDDTTSDVRIPVYQGESGIDAAAQFFGISQDTAAWLFYGDHYEDQGLVDDTRLIKPKMVAKAIRKVIASKGKIPKEYRVKEAA